VSGPILLVGHDALADAIERRLVAAGAAVLRPPELDDQTLGGVSALALVEDDDSRNVDLLLAARHARADLPIVARLFDDTLADYLRETLEQVTILSVSAVAAPVMAARALAVAAGAASRLGERAAPVRIADPPDRMLLWFLGMVAVLVISGALLFSRILDLRFMDALYFVWTTVMTVGYGDISLRNSSDGAKLLGMSLMLAGAGFIAVLFGLLSERVLSRRLRLQQGRVKVGGRGHVLVVGAGNVGFRVAEMVAQGGRRVVVIERDEESRNAASLRAAGHQVIVADVTSAGTLDLAGLDRAAAVVALTDSDAVNLRVALAVRSGGGPRPVVARLDSPQLSGHLESRGDAVAMSPVALAAEAFARAALAAADSGPETA
jgi:voltage-gated potassium channel Kch